MAPCALLPPRATISPPPVPLPGPGAPSGLVLAVVSAPEQGQKMPGLGAWAYPPSTWEVDPGGSGVQGHLQLIPGWGWLQTSGPPDSTSPVVKPQVKCWSWCQGFEYGRQVLNSATAPAGFASMRPGCMSPRQAWEVGAVSRDAVSTPRSLTRQAPKLREDCTVGPVECYHFCRSLEPQARSWWDWIQSQLLLPQGHPGGMGRSSHTVSGLFLGHGGVFFDLYRD